MKRDQLLRWIERWQWPLTLLVWTWLLLDEESRARRNADAR
jgi:hypothetical protein